MTCEMNRFGEKERLKATSGSGGRRRLRKRRSGDPLAPRIRVSLRRLAANVWWWTGGGSRLGLDGRQSPERERRLFHFYIKKQNFKNICRIGKFSKMGACRPPNGRQDACRPSSWQQDLNVKKFIFRSWAPRAH